MIRYFCDSCKAERDDVVCSRCGRDTRAIAPGEIAAASAPEPRPLDPVPTPAPEPRRLDAVPAPAPEPRYEPRYEPPRFETAPRVDEPELAAPPASQDREIRGLDEFHALLDRRMEAVIICGTAKSGKSEIAAGFIRANNVYRGEAQFLNLRATLRTDYALGATNPDEVWYQLIDDKRVFLDPSGEFFRALSLDERRRLGLPDLTENDFRFMRRAVRHLAGIVLVVDLTRAVDARDFKAWRRQEDEFNFVLSALRWLRWEKEPRPETIGVTTNIAQRANALPMIDRPVLVLFSKADQLTEYLNTPPLEFAKRRLPILHGALMTHAKRFRYDFCHTMTRTATGTDEEVDHPCGVLLPMEWMLENPFRRLPFQIPTRFLGGGK